MAIEHPELWNWHLFFKLTDREIRILRLRWLEGHSLKDVGAIIGVTRERVRQIESKAMRRLKLFSEGLVNAEHGQTLIERVVECEKDVRELRLQIQQHHGGAEPCNSHGSKT